MMRILLDHKLMENVKPNKFQDNIHNQQLQAKRHFAWEEE